MNYETNDYESAASGSGEAPSTDDDQPAGQLEYAAEPADDELSPDASATEEYDTYVYNDLVTVVINVPREARSIPPTIVININLNQD